MRKTLSLVLIVMTYWMSTWMVTDIHDVVRGGDQPHPIFSTHTAAAATALQPGEETAPPGCRVCSYDHGGHVGQTLPAMALVVPFDPRDTAAAPIHPCGRPSQTTSPDLRPPIA